MLCGINIEPFTAEVLSGETISFTVTKEGECGEPSYEWSVEIAVESKVDKVGATR